MRLIKTKLIYNVEWAVLYTIYGMTSPVTTREVTCPPTPPTWSALPSPTLTCPSAPACAAWPGPSTDSLTRRYSAWIS